MNINKLVQLMLNIYSGLVTLLLLILLIVSIPNGGLVLINFNAYGELTIELILMPITAIFILSFAIYVYKKEENEK